MERKVKGSLLIDYIRMIRANSDLPWDQYLNDEDFQLLEGRVLLSNWYPLETFQRTGLGVFNLLAKGNLEAVRVWGRISMEQLSKIYKQLIVEGDPLSAIKKFIILRGQFFNFEPIALQEESSTQIKMKIEMDKDLPGLEPYTYQLMGGLERLIEMCGGKNIKTEIVSKAWEGAQETSIRAKWS